VLVDFTRPEAVIHIDRVYVPAIQPRVRLVRAALAIDGESPVDLIRNDEWVVDFGTTS